MITVNYDFYKHTYGGSTLDENVFNRIIPFSTKVLLNRTTSTIRTIEDDYENTDLVYSIRMCLCHLAERIAFYQSSDDKTIKSQSVGKMSITYATDDSHTAISDDYARIIKLWLSEYGYTNCVWL